MSGATYPPLLAEGKVAFEERAGGDFIICKFDNGAAMMLSRKDMMRTARHMMNYSVDRFAAQPAEIVKFKVKAKA